MAKLELSLMWEKLLNKNIIFNALKERGRSKRYRSEVLRAMVGRKQMERERITSYSDVILKLALELKADMKDGSLWR